MVAVIFTTLIPDWIDSTEEESVIAVVEVAVADAAVAKNLNWNIVQRRSIKRYRFTAGGKIAKCHFWPWRLGRGRCHRRIVGQKRRHSLANNDLPGHWRPPSRERLHPGRYAEVITGSRAGKSTPARCRTAWLSRQWRRTPRRLSPKTSQQGTWRRKSASAVTATTRTASRHRQ